MRQTSNLIAIKQTTFRISFTNSAQMMMLVDRKSTVKIQIIQFSSHFRFGLLNQGAYFEQLKYPF